jgi:hypothetical protein
MNIKYDKIINTKIYVDFNVIAFRLGKDYASGKISKEIYLEQLEYSQRSK